MLIFLVMTFEWSLDKNLFWKETFDEWKCFIFLKRHRQFYGPINVNITFLPSNRYGPRTYSPLDREVPDNFDCVMKCLKRSILWLCKKPFFIPLRLNLGGQRWCTLYTPGCRTMPTSNHFWVTVVFENVHRVWFSLHRASGYELRF